MGIPLLSPPGVDIELPNGEDEDDDLGDDDPHKGKEDEQKHSVIISTPGLLPGEYNSYMAHTWLIQMAHTQHINHTYMAHTNGTYRAHTQLIHGTYTAYK